MAKLNWDANDFQNSQDSSGTTSDNISHSGDLQQGYSHGSLTRGLVAYYPMEKGEGEVLHDGAMDNLGQINGATWNSGEISQNSLSFNGVEDHIVIGFVPVVFNGAEEFSISTWFKTSENSDQTFVSLADDGNTNYRINQNSNGDWVLSFERNGDNTNAQTDVTDGKWHHGVIKYSNTKGFSFYLDGKSDGSTGDSTWTYSGTEVKIGRRLDIDSEDPFNGELDDVRIYNRALSEPEIEALYNDGNGVKSGVEVKEQNVPGLNQGGVLRYKFNGTVADAWNSNDAVDNTSSGFDTGIFDDAKKFDGTDDEVDIQKTSADLDVNNTGSFSCWFKPENNLADINRRIIEDRGNQTDSDFFVIFTDTNSKINLSLNDGSTQHELTTDFSCTLNEWTHVMALLEEASGKILIYVNGSLEDVATGYNGSWDTSDTLKIAGDGGWTGQRHEGLIDDVRIYDKALSPVQVEELYHKGAYRIPRKSTLQ